jgi:hypothetical protein
VIVARSETKRFGYRIKLDRTVDVVCESLQQPARAVRNVVWFRNNHSRSLLPASTLKAEAAEKVAAATDWEQAK